jgi:hypothetical protein
MNYGRHEDSGSCRSGRLASAVADDVCPVPDPLETQEESERFHFHDLKGITVSGLRMERETVRLALILDPGGDPWRLSRLSKIDEELALREGGRTS